MARPTSPRDALAEAIAARDAFDAGLAALRSAHRNAESVVFDAQAELAAAEAGIAESRAAAVQSLTHCGGSANAGAASMKAARDRLEAARDRLDVAREARDLMTAAIKGEDERRGWMPDKVKAAVGAVLSVPLVEMATDLFEIQAEVEKIKSVLFFLIKKGATLPSGDEQKKLEWVIAGSTSVTSVAERDAEVLPPWQAAVSALQIDPKTPLPR